MEDPCGVPIETGGGRLGEPWKTRVDCHSDRKDETQSTIEKGVCLARREALRVEALTLSKCALMSMKRGETFSLGLWRVLISCVSERQASEALKPGREPHWLGWSMFLERAIAESLTLMTRWRIFDTVLRRTIMRKDAGELYEVFPGLSRTTPFAVFSEGEWYPKTTRGERNSKRPHGVKVDSFPDRIRNTVRSRGRGGGGVA